VLAVSVTGLVAMLIQGCKREQPTDNTLGMDTNPPAMTDTNPPVVDTNPPIMIPPATNPPSVVVPPVETGGTEYVVVAGDTLGKIAKAHGVSLKALQDANPGVDSKKLKIKQKLIIPPSTKATEAMSYVAADTSGEVYTIKSGDTLDKIARAHHTTAKAIMAANNLTTTKILVGHKLKIPANAEATPAVAAPVDTGFTSAPSATMPPK